MEKVHLVAVDYGTEGVARDASKFIAFQFRTDAENFVRRANECGGYVGERIILEIEFVGN